MFFGLLLRPLAAQIIQHPAHVPHGLLGPGDAAFGEKHGAKKGDGLVQREGVAALLLQLGQPQFVGVNLRLQAVAEGRVQVLAEVAQDIGCPGEAAHQRLADAQVSQVIDQLMESVGQV